MRRPEEVIRRRMSFEQLQRGFDTLPPEMRANGQTESFALASSILRAFMDAEWWVARHVISDGRDYDISRTRSRIRHEQRAHRRSEPTACPQPDGQNEEGRQITAYHRHRDGGEGVQAVALWRSEDNRSGIGRRQMIDLFDPRLSAPPRGDSRALAPYRHHRPPVIDLFDEDNFGPQRERQPRRAVRSGFNFPYRVFDCVPLLRAVGLPVPRQ
jgi:hypothetical protein